MTKVAPGEKKNRGTIALLGLFFGLGFVAGFFCCYAYLDQRNPVQVLEVRTSPQPEHSDSTADQSPLELPSPDDSQVEEPQIVEIESELALEGDYLGEDENGYFIGGVIINKSDHAFDAVRIAFDLCDSRGAAYGQVTDRIMERMEPGDSWGFTIYILYTDMPSFATYRLHSIMGVTK